MFLMAVWFFRSKKEDDEQETDDKQEQMKIRLILRLSFGQMPSQVARSISCNTCMHFEKIFDPFNHLTKGCYFVIL